MVNDVDLVHPVWRWEKRAFITTDPVAGSTVKILFIQ